MSKHTPMLTKPIDAITETDIQSLCDNRVAEGRTLDFKAEPPGLKDDATKEFLADVSSFANTAGGDIVIGLAEGKGPDGNTVAEDLCGFSGHDLDALTLRLDNLIRDGIKPRIQPPPIKAVRLANGNLLLVVRISPSWAGPHVVDHKGRWRFFARNSAGKYPMDVDEVRSAFTSANDRIQQVRKFRRGRLKAINSHDETIPAVSGEGPGRAVLHLLPSAMFNVSAAVDLSVFDEEEVSFPGYQQVKGAPRDAYFNADGYLIKDLEGFHGNCIRFFQFFRNGAMEVVWPLDHSDVIENTLEEQAAHYLAEFLEVARARGVPPPALVALSLLSVRNYRVFNPPRVQVRYSSRRIDRGDLALPEAPVMDLNARAEIVLHPVFDALYQASGYPRSFSYDGHGVWMLGAVNARNRRAD